MNKQNYISVFLLLSCLFYSHTSKAQDISLFQQFNGHYDYIAFGNTLNTVENGPNSPCTINTSSSASFNLNSDNTIVAAYLYWAGSDDGDFDIELNNIPITAERTFSDTLSEGRTFFAAYADVTNIILSQGNGNYTISEFDLTSVITPYCPTGTNFGGWAITVIYENQSLPLNQLNVYDGLESVPQQLTITLDNLNVFDNIGAKIGFIAWEGDQALSVNETLQVNGSIIQNLPLNPGNNTFNGTNSFTGASNLYNMDIDFYSIQNYIQIGDTTATISLTSGQDFVMINNIITVLNSQLPDATIITDIVNTNCDSREINFDYTIYNENSTAVLPQNTPIAIYANTSIIGSAVTASEIPIGGNIQQNITLTIPTNIDTNFELIIVVDDIGNGTGIVNEINENNNTFSTIVNLPVSPLADDLENLGVCDHLTELTFDLTLQENNFTNTNLIFNYYETSADATNATNSIENPTMYTNTSNPQTIYLELIDASSLCKTITDFQIEVLESPIITQPNDLEKCLQPNGEVVTFNLTENNDTITNQSGVSFTFYENMNTDGSLENEITSPLEYENIQNPQTVYVQVENQNGCIVTTSFALVLNECEIQIPSGISPNGDGRNDDFIISNIELYPNHKLLIYNRLGTLIYEGDKNTPHWNGKANRGSKQEKKLPVSTYFYVLILNTNSQINTLSNKQRYTGWVYLAN